MLSRYIGTGEQDPAGSLFRIARRSIVGCALVAGLGGLASSPASAATPSAQSEVDRLCEGLGSTPISLDEARAAGAYFAEDRPDSSNFKCGDGKIVTIVTQGGKVSPYANFYFPRSEGKRLEQDRKRQGALRSEVDRAPLRKLPDRREPPSFTLPE